MYRYILLILLNMALIACSGSDNGSGGGPNPPKGDNTPPMLMVENAYSVQENISGAIFSVSSSDADGDPVIISITEKRESTLFTLDSETNQVSFVAPPNYESPKDLNHDNIYTLEVSASDGTNEPVYQDVMVTVTDVSQIEFKVLSPMPGSSLRMVGKKVKFKGVVVDVEDDIIDEGDLIGATLNGQAIDVVNGQWQAEADLPKFNNTVSFEITSTSGIKTQEYNYVNGISVARLDDLHYDEANNRLLGWDWTQKILFSYDAGTGERSVIFSAHEQITDNTNNSPLTTESVANAMSGNFSLTPDNSAALFAAHSRVLSVNLNTGSYSVIEPTPAPAIVRVISAVYSSLLEKFILLYNDGSFYTLDQQGNSTLFYTLEESFRDSYNFLPNSSKLRIHSDEKSIYFSFYNRCEISNNVCTISEYGIANLDLTSKEVEVVFSTVDLSEQYDVSSAQFSTFSINDENKVRFLASSNDGVVLLEYDTLGNAESVVKNFNNVIGKDAKRGRSHWALGKEQDLFFYNVQVDGLYKMNMSTSNYELISKDTFDDQGLMGSQAIVDIKNKRFIVPSESGLWQIPQDGVKPTLLVEGLSAPVSDNMTFNLLGKIYSPERNSLIGIVSTPEEGINTADIKYRLVEYNLDKKQALVLFGDDSLGQSFTISWRHNFPSYDSSKNIFYFYGLIGKNTAENIDPYNDDNWDFFGIDLANKALIDGPSKVFFANAGLDQNAIDVIRNDLSLRFPFRQKFDFNNNDIIAVNRGFSFGPDQHPLTVERLSLNSFSRQAIKQIPFDVPTNINAKESLIVGEKMFFSDLPVGYGHSSSLYMINLNSGEYEILYDESYSGNYTLGFLRVVAYDPSTEIVYFRDFTYGGLFSYDMQLKQLSLMFR